MTAGWNVVRASELERATPPDARLRIMLADDAVAIVGNVRRDAHTFPRPKVLIGIVGDPFPLVREDADELLVCLDTPADTTPDAGLFADTE